VYDLADFSPVGSVRVDHPDPSIFTVLSAPLDEQGASSLDFVFFPPRWEVTEHTFRPPFFHRNATTEINGIISDPAHGREDPFAPGCAFLTPSMTAHGVVARSVERALRMSDERADRAVRMPDAAAWFQFETALPIRLTRWAQSGAQRVRDWPSIWGAHRARFDPRRP
jgi:homogentisate 1,2-dioxygenase